MPVTESESSYRGCGGSYFFTTRHLNAACNFVGLIVVVVIVVGYVVGVVVIGAGFIVIASTSTYSI